MSFKKKKKTQPVIPWLVYDEMDVSRDRKLILIAIRTVASVSGESEIYEVEAWEQLGITPCMATDCKVFPRLWCQLYFQVRCCFSWQHKSRWYHAITAPRHNSNMTLMVRNHSTLHMHWTNLLSPLLTLFSPPSNHWNMKHFLSVIWGGQIHFLDVLQT